VGWKVGNKTNNRCSLITDFRVSPCKSDLKNNFSNMARVRPGTFLLKNRINSNRAKIEYRVLLAILFTKYSSLLLGQHERSRIRGKFLRGSVDKIGHVSLRELRPPPPRRSLGLPTKAPLASRAALPFLAPTTREGAVRLLGRRWWLRDACSEQMPPPRWRSSRISLPSRSRCSAPLAVPRGERRKVESFLGAEDTSHSRACARFIFASVGVVRGNPGVPRIRKIWGFRLDGIGYFACSINSNNSSDRVLSRVLQLYL
jgi:hypothetical protein